ncbi:MAG: HNH endonuclease [Burkholderiaceae bacterium]|jgi:5-methylcytosine-specific restriction endonuclease McrA|nr:HNH endonuclease [Burkholderiaceae bacterium]
MHLESSPRILIIDSHGQPVRWAVLPRAARYYASGKVVTDLGESLFAMAGGLQERSGLRSEFVTSSIVMIRGRHRIPYGHAHVGLTKHRLFVRDRHVCAYCGGLFAESDLTVEHIQPVSRGGRQTWTNVVTACRSCNTRKGNRTPEEARMPLLYVPYAVCRNEGFILSNRRILADQMAFLQATLPKYSRWAHV